MRFFSSAACSGFDTMRSGKPGTTSGTRSTHSGGFSQFSRNSFRRRAAAAMLAPAISSAMQGAEVALAWIDSETGIKCKVKIDWRHGTRLLADVKSALDVTRDGFSKACARMQYALSAAMYCEGVSQVTGEEPEWAFIACEKEAPNTVAVYRASDAFLRRGHQDFRRAMRRLAECRSRNHFPMLQGDGDWESIDLPRWA